MTIGRIPSVEGGIQPTIVDAKGDLIAATAADTVSRLAVGANNTVLTADSSTATGLKWAAPAAPTFVGVSAYKSTNQSVNNVTDTAITWNAEDFDTDGFHDNSTNNTRFTIPSGKGGYYLLNCLIAGEVATINRFLAAIKKNGTTSVLQFEVSSTSSESGPTGSGIVNLSAGDYIEVIVYHNRGSANSISGATAYSKFSMQYLGA